MRFITRAFIGAALLSAAVATVASAETSTLMSTQNADNVAITGGSINGTPIGATTPSTGAFSSITSTTPPTVANGGTGLQTLTAHGILIGEGTSNPAFVGPCSTGQVILGQGGSSDPVCGNPSVGGNLVTNGAFTLDQQNEGSGPTPSSSTAARVADRWFSQWVVSTSGAGNPTISQAAIGTGNTLVPKELKITANATNGTSSPAAYNFITYQSIEGTDVADLQEGTANAQAFTVSVWLKSSITGTMDVFVQNGAAAQSYSHDCAVTAATWTQCTFTVPGDTTGTWNKTRDSIGMVVGVTAACGSTFQQTGNTWATSTSNCTSNQTELTNSVSATLEITAVKVERGSVSTQYVEEAGSVLLAKAERFYRKSFTQGTAPATNAGTAKGEACYLNPIAAGEGSITVAYPQMYNGSVTVTTYNPSAANANFRDETGSADVTIGTAIANTTNLFLPTNATVATIAHKVCVQYTVDEGF